jgi:nitroreductase
MDEPAPVDHPVHELIASRWSPYVFASRPVAAEDLRALFEAARWAPPCFNEQPWRYIVGERSSAGEFERILSCLAEGNRQWAQHAPVIALGVVALNFARNGKPNDAARHDLGLASGNLLTEATARGLSVHQMRGILPDRAREIYAIPDDHEAFTGLAIGYAGEPGDRPELAGRDGERRPRRPTSEFVFAGSWGESARL